MLLYWEVVWFLFLCPTPQGSNHNFNSAGFGLVIAEGWEGMKAEHDWRVHIHQKTESAGENEGVIVAVLPPSLLAQKGYGEEATWGY